MTLSYRDVVSREFITLVHNESRMECEVAVVIEEGKGRREGLLRIEGEVEELGQKWREKRVIEFTPTMKSAMNEAIRALDLYLFDGRVVGKIEKEAYCDLSDELRIGYVNAGSSSSCYLRSSKDGRVIEATFKDLKGLVEVSSAFSRLEG